MLAGGGVDEGRDEGGTPLKWVVAFVKHGNNRSLFSPVYFFRREIREKNKQKKRKSDENGFWARS